MTPNDLRRHFDELAQRLRDAGEYDAAARAEVLREWHTNDAFRRRLAEHTWEANQAASR